MKLYSELIYLLMIYLRCCQ